MTPCKYVDELYITINYINCTIPTSENGIITVRSFVLTLRRAVKTTGEQLLYIIIVEWSCTEWQVTKHFHSFYRFYLYHKFSVEKSDNFIL